MTLLLDETMMPMNDVTAKPMGIVNSCVRVSSRIKSGQVLLRETELT
jgi:hypothetical protein